MYTLPNDYFETVFQTDPEVAEALQGERIRQHDCLDLNPGENYASPAVLKALGSTMTNKYADGYPGRRLFFACEHVDTVEQLAIDRLKAIYGAEHANVQSNCGGDTNLTVFYAMLRPGDTVLGPDLKQGGQMSHGNPRNITGKLYNHVGYSLDPQTQQLDYDIIRDEALKHKPKLIISGSTNYPRDIDYARFREIADEAGAYFLADIAQFAGLIAGGQMNNPTPCADFVTASTHKTMRGPRGGFVLCRSGYAQAIDDAAWPGTQGSPQMHTIAAKAVCFGEAMQPEFREYQAQVVANARALAAALRAHGIRVASGGTDSHIVDFSVTEQGRTGNETMALLADCNIIACKYAFPLESMPEGQFSGMRFATSCMTTRGMREPEMQVLADCVIDATSRGEAAAASIRQRVSQMTEAFPLY